MMNNNQLFIHVRMRAFVAIAKHYTLLQLTFKELELQIAYHKHHCIFITTKN